MGNWNDIEDRDPIQCEGQKNISQYKAIKPLFVFWYYRLHNERGAS